MMQRPRLLSLNVLATETGRDRRMARRLANRAPDGKLNGKPAAWFLRSALAGLREHEKPEKAAGRGSDLLDQIVHGVDAEGATVLRKQLCVPRHMISCQAGAIHT